MPRSLAAAALGLLLAGCLNTPAPTPSASASPSPTPAALCAVNVEPTTITVDPDIGASDDVLVFTGVGFPANGSVSIAFTPATSVLDFPTDARGGFTASVAAAPETTYPAPPDVPLGAVTWSITGWTSPEPRQSPAACDTQVVVTIAFTHAPAATPDTTLVAGDYAEITVDGLKVRAAPSLSGTAVGALFPGDVVRSWPLARWPTATPGI